MLSHCRSSPQFLHFDLESHSHNYLILRQICAHASLPARHLANNTQGIQKSKLTITAALRWLARYR